MQCTLASGIDINIEHSGAGEGISPWRIQQRNCVFYRSANVASTFYFCWFCVCLAVERLSPSPTRCSSGTGEEAAGNQEAGIPAYRRDLQWEIDDVLCAVKVIM